jgi:hypothetical protein
VNLREIGRERKSVRAIYRVSLELTSSMYQILCGSSGLSNPPYLWVSFRSGQPTLSFLLPRVLERFLDAFRSWLWIYDRETRAFVFLVISYEWLLPTPPFFLFESKYAKCVGKYITLFLLIRLILVGPPAALLVKPAVVIHQNIILVKNSDIYRGQVRIVLEGPWIVLVKKPICLFYPFVWQCCPPYNT